MTPNEDQRMLHEVEQSERWLRGVMDSHPAPSADRLDELKRVVRSELGGANDSAMPSADALARVKAAVHHELDQTSAAPIEFSQRSAAPRHRRYSLVLGGLATAAALGLFFRLGDDTVRPSNRPVSQVSDLEDFVDVFAGEAASTTDSASTKDSAVEAGSDTAKFEEEIDALDEELDRLQTETWSASEVG
jgi:hypothetical protein